MHTYKRTIGITGSHYTRDFEKKKHHKNKVRDINEATVIKHFKAGKAEILVYFEEKDESILITPDSDPDLIREFLGVAFL